MIGLGGKSVGGWKGGGKVILGLAGGASKGQFGVFRFLVFRERQGVTFDLGFFRVVHNGINAARRANGESTRTARLSVLYFEDRPGLQLAQGKRVYLRPA